MLLHMAIPGPHLKYCLKASSPLFKRTSLALRSLDEASSLRFLLSRQTHLQLEDVDTQPQCMSSKKFGALQQRGPKLSIKNWIEYPRASWLWPSKMQKTLNLAHCWRKRKPTDNFTLEVTFKTVVTCVLWNLNWNEQSTENSWESLLRQLTRNQQGNDDEATQFRQIRSCLTNLISSWTKLQIELIGTKVWKYAILTFRRPLISWNTGFFIWKWRPSGGFLGEQLDNKKSEGWIF